MSVVEVVGSHVGIVTFSDERLFTNGVLDPQPSDLDVSCIPNASGAHQMVAFEIVSTLMLVDRPILSFTCLVKISRAGPSTIPFQNSGFALDRLLPKNPQNYLPCYQSPACVGYLSSLPAHSESTGILTMSLYS